MTPSVVAALACHDVETGVPLFSPKDMPELNRVPAGSFNSIIDAVQRVADGLSLDPTTPATETGSDSRPDSDAPSSPSASG